MNKDDVATEITEDEGISPRRHEDTTCIHKEVAEVTEESDGGDAGLRVTGER